MTQNRQRTVLGVGLVIALGVLVIDWISRGPESAIADDAVEDGIIQSDIGATGSEEADASARISEKSSNKVISDLLERFADRAPVDQTDLADAFAPSARWSPPEQDQVEPNQIKLRAREFAASYQLTAVIRGGDEGRVMLNDSIVRVGQSIDGYTLISVGGDNAVFEGSEDRIELAVAEAGVRILPIMRITTPASQDKTGSVNEP